MFSMIPYRYNRMPRKPMEDPVRAMDPFFADLFRPFFGEGAMSMKVDVEDRGDSYLLSADLPGVKKENVSVDIREGVLTVTASSNEDKEENASGYLCRERRVGSVSRSFRLDGVKEEEISASFEDGVLRLVLPKENAQPEDNVRRIPID